MKLATLTMSKDYNGEKHQEVRDYEEMKEVGSFTVFILKTPIRNPYLVHLYFKTKHIDEMIIHHGDDL